MRKIALVFALASLALTVPAAHAAHITCSNSSQVPNANLLGYDFTIDVPVSNSGSGSGAGKATTSLSVTVPADSTIVTLSQFVTAGKHSASCVITDSGLPLELVLSDVIFSKFEIVNGPVSGKTSSAVQLTLTYSKYTLTSAQ